MEALFIYFLKANGLLVTFFLAYYFLLRKETFFNKNRWFLIFGLLASVLLPLITFTKTVWVDPTPIVYEAVSNDFVPYIIENKAIEEPVDWNSILIYVYFGISIILVLRFLIEVLSFFRIVSFGKRTKTKEAILIDNSANENPFSFFKHIVFNSQMFSEEELQHIIIHENIHVKEKHSIDVLISKLFCAFFWINPIMWLYQKEMLQNLEYIADDKASTIAQDKINYQKTLLKVVTNQHQLSITNQFYQSLIKKRIVMLNTNQSNQKKSWKYALILPVLSAFILLFQVETVAQVKEEKVEKSTEIKADTVVWVKDFKDEFNSKMDNNAVYTSEVVQFIINKNTTDSEIERETKKLKKDYNIQLSITKIKRNEKNEIIALNAKFEDENKTSGHISIKSDEPIKPIRFFKELGENGNIGFDRNDKSTFFANMNSQNKNSKEVQIEWKDASNLSKNSKSNRLYIINGEEVEENDIPSGTTLEIDGAIIELSNEDGIKKYGQKGKNGVLVFEGKSNFKNDDETVIYINDKKVSKKEMNKLNPKEIASVNVNKSDLKNQIRIYTKNSKGIDDDTKIYINGKEVSKDELDELDKNEIQSINVNKTNRIIKIEKKRIDAEIEKAKAEIEKAKLDIEKTKPEIERAKIEIEKAKTEIRNRKAISGGNWNDVEKELEEISKKEMELKAQRNSKLSKEQLEARRKKREELNEQRRKLIDERKKKIEIRKKQFEEKRNE
ncbi:M56 family metallopeptidase [Flavobacterium ponti]|uniref:M56 family metallopeptidase n=1 Tax=Flavobacterium ponti TaxID=665133 RepID=A0ABV9P494_9FLAO